MSAESSPAEPVAPNEAVVAIDTTSHPRKSYRRKYRKIMVKFEEKMRESTTLFRDEQRIFDISQRLAEQTDQILQLLTELNSCPQIPTRMRYDLSHPSAPTRPDVHRDEQAAFESLRVARQKVQKGEITQNEYLEKEQELLDSIEFRPSKSYASYVRGGIPVQGHATTTESSNPLAGGFLSSRQEEQYLQSLDAFIDGKENNPRSHAINNLGHRNGEKSSERERETQLRNPVSVYNWLRKNQPQVFLQDPDNDKTKVGSRTSKRAQAARESKQESELYDEEGGPHESNLAGKRKRKRDEDGGYRPKGGHPRPAKRKREESGRRSKRTSMDITAF